MTTLSKKLFNFRNISNGSAFVIELSETYSLKEIISELENMLQSDSRQVSEALFFLRQISITDRGQKDFNEVVASFRKEIPNSRIFSLMEKLLYSSDEDTRSRTIYAFGKMCFPEQSLVLQKAIDFYVRESPLQLGELLFEFTWLSGETDINILQALAKDKNPEVKKGIEWFLDHISEQEKDSIKKELGY